MKLLQANREPRIEGLEELPGKSNYLIGNDPAKWRTNITNYAKVKYEAIYPGVDLVFYGNQSGLEHDFILAPGTNPEVIQLGFQGADELRIDTHDDLVLRVSGGEVRLHKPTAYQLIPAAGAGVTYRSTGKKFITAGYVLRGNRVGFAVGAYDATKPLIIDPTLSYSTYLGGSGNDFNQSGSGIAVDATGNAYVTGQTSSVDFPTTSPFQGASGGGLDVFVAKLSSSGTTLLYSTYLGGSGNDSGAAIAIDAAGNAYVTGKTSSVNFPTKNSFQGTLASSTNSANAFIAKLDTTGSTLLYSTYLGGSRFDYSTSIAVDGVGGAYVTGQTSSVDFPTKNPFQAGLSGPYDAFVTKIDTTASGGTSLVYSTYFGGSSVDGGGAIAVDSSGDAYFTGYTLSSNLPTLNPVQASIGGVCSPLLPQPCADAFVAELNAAGSALVFSTYLGGAVDDRGTAIAIDSSGNTYVAGSTSSSNFPITMNAAQNMIRGASNAFVAKLNAAGSMLLYCTYLGGSNVDAAYGIALDPSGSAYVTGEATSIDFPIVYPVQVPAPSGSRAFVTKLNPAGSALVYSSLIGGTGSENGSKTGAEGGVGIGVDAAGNAYVTGNTGSSDFPTVNALQASLRDLSDAFVLKIAPIPGPALATSPASLSFVTNPPQQINTTSPPQQVTLANEGDGALTITGIAVAGTNSGDFAQTNTCGMLPAALASGASCAVSVTFASTATGTRSGTLTISDNAAGSPHMVSLVGSVAPPDFSVSVSPATATISSGGTATSTLTISPLNNFAGSVSLTCSSLPALSNCTFSPNQVTPGAHSANSTLTITTTAGSALGQPVGQWFTKPLYVVWAVVLGTVLAWIRNSRRTPDKSRAASVPIGLLLMLLAGCSGNGKTNATGTPLGTGTPPGTYSVTVTGTSSSLQHSTTLTLTVQ